MESFWITGAKTVGFVYKSKKKLCILSAIRST